MLTGGRSIRARRHSRLLLAGWRRGGILRARRIDTQAGARGNRRVSPQRRSGAGRAGGRQRWAGRPQRQIRLIVAIVLIIQIEIVIIQVAFVQVPPRFPVKGQARAWNRAKGRFLYRLFLWLVVQIVNRRRGGILVVRVVIMHRARAIIGPRRRALAPIPQQARSKNATGQGRPIALRRGCGSAHRVGIVITVAVRAITAAGRLVAGG